MPIPDFKLLSSEYPDYWRFRYPEDVKKMVGGTVNLSDIGNTCTIRMSHAMNKAGVPIPKHWRGVTSRKGKNGLYYIIRVVDFDPWMRFQFGKPDEEFAKDQGKAFNRSKIEGFQGVIGFDIKFKDATGHFDLWYLNTFSHENNGGEDYFTNAKRITLWHTGLRTLSASG